MTPEERQMLQALVNRIKAAPAQQRDQEADAMLRDLVQQRPDTAYLLAQTVLMQDLALRNAQAQITDLQRQVQAAQSARPAQGSGSFLGGLFGSSPPPPGPPQYRAPGPSGAPPAAGAGPWNRPAAAPPPQAYYTAPGAPVLQPSQGSSFLQQAATTAVGIAGGALLFEGIQSLFGPHYGTGFIGGGPWGGMGYGPSLTEETIVNNYYDSPPPLQGDSGAGYTPSNDQGGVDPGGYQNTDYDTSQDTGGVDNTDFDSGDSSDFGGGDSGGGDDFV